jgi:hypothetical protein
MKMAIVSINHVRSLTFKHNVHYNLFPNIYRFQTEKIKCLKKNNMLKYSNFIQQKPTNCQIVNKTPTREMFTPHLKAMLKSFFTEISQFVFRYRNVHE